MKKNDCPNGVIFITFNSIDTDSGRNSKRCCRAMGQQLYFCRCNRIVRWRCCINLERKCAPLSRRGKDISWKIF